MGQGKDRRDQELLEALGVTNPLCEIYRLRGVIEFAIDYLEAEGDTREPHLETAIAWLRAAIKPNGGQSSD